MMSIYALKPKFQNLLRPLVRALYNRGVTANQVTLAACAGAVAGAAAHPDLATALTERNNFSLYDLDLRQPSAWIFGNEGNGVSPDILAAATATVKIPMQGAVESLNIAQAATICLFEQMRQRLAA